MAAKMTWHQVRWIGLFVIIALLGGCADSYELRGTPYNPVIAAPQISGTNPDGSLFRLADLKDQVKVVSFGYTFCPDVCPLTLANMKTVYESLTMEEQAQLAIVFITVDPERDTPERLAGYVGAFHENFYGVQLDESALAQAKKEYGVFAEKRTLEASQSAADYLMDHTAFVYVVDKDNNLREIFPHDAPTADIAADLRYLIGR